MYVKLCVKFHVSMISVVAVDKYGSQITSISDNAVRSMCIWTIHKNMCINFEFDDKQFSGCGHK